jgi:sec-independent protein translocase protein TatC
VSAAPPTDENGDEVDATRAPLMEHLIELRSRLIKALLAIAAAFVVCFAFADQIFNILLWPYEYAAGPQKELQIIYTAPQEYLITQIKLALFGAVFIAFPIIAAQIYKFVAPGLYKNERSAFYPYLIATPILFFAGAAFVYFLALPLAMKFFLSNICRSSWR